VLITGRKRMPNAEQTLTPATSDCRKRRYHLRPAACTYDSGTICAGAWSASSIMDAEDSHSLDNEQQFWTGGYQSLGSPGDYR